METQSLIPQLNPLYVKFGHFDDIKTIIESRKFYPIFITGLSGNGKTLMSEQICALLKRRLFRVNITIESDEDDTLGGMRMSNGTTTWHDGPVVQAMEGGDILLLDEVDLASTKIMCLQPILEGSGIYLKKINRYVKPKEGFNIIATANTKGQGTESDKFVGTNVLNEAFLERFAVTFEQPYPKAAVERTILKKVFQSNLQDDDEFIELLLQWADSIRTTFDKDGISEVISTRRLVHIANAYAMFKDRKKALELCINRFDETIKTGFLSLFEKYEQTKDVAQSIEKKEPKPHPKGMDLDSILATNIDVDKLMSKIKP